MPEVLAPLRLVFPATPRSVSAARHAVSEFARRGNRRVDEGRVGLAVTEAVGNAVKHAYPDREPGSVELFAEWSDRGLHVRISDQGIGMQPNRKGHDLGLGLRLMEVACDDYELDANPGVTIQMVFTYREARDRPRRRRFR